MLSFPSKNDNSFFLTGQVFSKKTDPGGGKPTYFYIWPHKGHFMSSDASLGMTQFRI